MLSPSARAFLTAIVCIAAATACFGGAPLDLGVAAAAPQVTCDTGCKTNWERAQLWVVKHSAWKIQTATDVLIETFNPTEYSPTYGFTVTKEPIGSGRYTIKVAMACGNMFGCNPHADDVEASFNYYVATGVDVLATMTHGGAIQ